MQKRVALPPLVTGLSPKEGVPGTLVTIRGENLGVNQKDVIGLTICGTDCLLSTKWESSRKLVTRCNGSAKSGTGDVIVTTASGGVGSCSVTFRVYTVQIGPLQESAAWVDESRTLPLREVGPASTLSAIVEDDPLVLSSKLSDKRFAESYLSELFPEGTGNLRLENFIPSWYLLENHQNASFDDLKAGLSYMKKNSSCMQQGPRDVVKRNLGCYMSCLDSLAALDNKIREDKIKSGRHPTEDLKQEVQKIITKADGVFADVLGRKERADATRNTLSILQRFKFLFFLPKSISQNMQKGEYGLILNEYSRVKALFGETEIGLFKEAFEEVEKQMEKFKALLKKKLVEMPSTLEDQKKIIHYLLVLEPDSDPAWICLNAHKVWLQDVMWESQLKYHRIALQDRMTDDNSENEERMLNETPQKYNFVESICGCFSSKVLSFWKLALAYIKGALSSPKTVHKIDEIELILVSTFRLGCWLILNAVLPDALPQDALSKHKDKFVAWPPDKKHNILNLIHSLKSLRNCMVALQQQEFSMKQLQPLDDLCVTIRLRCLGHLIQSTTDGIVGLHSSGDPWKTLGTTSEYSKTQLPDLSEGMIYEILPLLKQILSTDYIGERDLFCMEKLKSSLMQNFETLLCAFQKTLELLSRISSSVVGQRPSTLAFGDSKSGAKVETGIKDKKLLIVLCNCDYYERYSIPSIVSRLKSAGVQNCDMLLNRALSSYGHLHSVLLNGYVAAKCSPYVEVINSAKYDSSDVKKVSNYIKDLVLCIVSVQAELFLVSPHLTNIIMTRVIHESIEKLTEHANKSGNLGNPTEDTKIALDLSAFQLSLHAYMSQGDRRILDMAKSARRSANEKLVSELLEQYKKTMRMSLLSLQQKPQPQG